MMGKFAVGKNAFAVSDRSGLRYRYNDMRREWNGLFVSKDEFELKHPQLEPRPRTVDPQALKDARPDRVEPAVARLLSFNAFTSGGAGSQIITVYEPGHGRSTSDVVRFREVLGFDGFNKSVLENAAGYSITVTTADRYTFTVATGTAAAGNTRGGGQNASAGPVTLVS
jgi:hypothetical protein